MDGLQRERLRQYLRSAGLESLVGREDAVELAVRDLLEAMTEKVAVGPADSLYMYAVPVLTEDGTCSVVDELAPVPYDLTPVLGGRTEQTTRRLALLERLVERVRETTGADWVGIYQRRRNVAGEEVLVKLSYVGRPSRAEFPLTHEFAERSTNSTVGLTGRATVIDDVGRHVEAGGGFYVCDDGIQSEACVPILDAAREVAGIVDVEAKPRGFFGAERLAVIAALALVAPPLLP
ncbi:MAG TPA: GAF domain-containing protein [Usitatibacter sp.]|jgi:putative methionine-R-sulfoxide reductase with GAF domain|nr:GAF domain-containing protein [Usitatibacter sp.]